MIQNKLSVGFCGGAFGDEGKGRIVDEYVDLYLKAGKKVVVYRPNGGANAGHTLELPNGHRIAMHLLPSGVLSPTATMILGKGMVIHPADFTIEIDDVKKSVGKDGLAQIMIDEMAFLSLDTHRAYESALKNWQDGGKGATGRGIGPAYADILLRHPLRMRDLIQFDQTKIEAHYNLYEALLKGLGVDLSQALVPSYGSDPIAVGTKKEFCARLKKYAKLMAPYVQDVYGFISKTWPDSTYGYIFELAQAIGLDNRYGVYPDITASDTTFDGIFAATDGVIDPNDIATKAAVIKATYMSSVGTRILPTKMEDDLASRIREDAKEYGATTKRPRGIAYVDLPAQRFFAKVGRTNCHVLTHMDVVYPNMPIKVCVGYERNGKSAEYRPDQEYLLTVKPLYEELPSWSATEIKQAKTYAELPTNAKQFLKFMAKGLGSRITLITTGPRRDQSIRVEED